MHFWPSRLIIKSWKQLAKYQYVGEQQEFMEKVHKAIVEFDVDFLQEV